MALMDGSDLTPLDAAYLEFLEHLKTRVVGARLKASTAANRELVLLYWEIGRDILERQAKHGWGSRIIEQLGGDLRRAFPEMRGLSARNLRYMRAFARAWDKPEFVQQAVAQIPWGHQCVLLDKVKEPEDREWYVRASLEHGWSRAVLVHQIESDLCRRQGQAQTNFERTLVAPQSDLARQVLKDPYKLEFLDVADDVAERELERRLLIHIRDFLLELGVGFAFVGSQHRLVVGDREFFLDLLFYHLTLRCYVVIELKTVAFEPEHVGKLNFYLTAVDEALRIPADNPSVGILLCKSGDRTVVEYALREANKPIGVSSYTLKGALPERLQASLPSRERLERELQGLDAPDENGR